MKVGPFQTLLRDLRYHEGFRGEAYKDTEGVWTIGYGFTEDVRPGDFIRLDEAEDYLVYRARIAVRDAKLIFRDFDGLSDARQVILANMAFNLGYNRLKQFKRMIAAVESKQFELAAQEMQDSKWYRQVGRRGEELVESMITDRYIDVRKNK